MDFSSSVHGSMHGSDVSDVDDT
jgi:hypothetical protein